MKVIPLLTLALLVAPAAAAPAQELRPSGIHTRDADGVRRGVLDLRPGARGVVRFDLRRVRSRFRRAELHLTVPRQPPEGTVVLRDGARRELARAGLPGRGRRIALDVTGAVRRGTRTSLYLSATMPVRAAARGTRRPRLVLRRSSSPRLPTPERIERAPGGAVAVGAAGDVACSPRTTGYNRGRGTWTDCRQELTARMLEAGALDAVLALGDLQYPRGALEDFRAGYGPSWGRLRSITRPVVGNHEYETPGASGYWDYFGAAGGTRGEGWYSFDIGGWHVVALNSTCEAVDCRAGSAQERWLRADLAASRARCTMALMHDPRFTSGPNANGLAGFPEVEALWRALHDARADVVLAGHMHNYERFGPLDAGGRRDPTAPMSFVIGTGGRNLADAFARHPASEAFSADAFGYLRLVLGDGVFDWRFVAEPGAAFSDAGSASCR